MVRCLVALAAFLFAGAALHAQPTDHASDEEIVVIGQRPIFVNGYPVRCRPAKGDPLDSFADFPTAGGESWLRWDVAQQRVLVDSNTKEDLPGQGDWERQSTAFKNFVFRSKEPGKLFCIGSKKGGGYGMLRKRYAPAKCEYIRFTGFVATRNARIRVWMNGGSSSTWTNTWVAGSRKWTPVMLQAGPIPHTSNWMGFGTLLDGPGDVWMYDPRFEVIDHKEFTKRDFARRDRCLQREKKELEEKRQRDAIRHRSG